MEYSKDIALGVKYFNVEDNVEVKIQKENKENKVNKSCTKISKQSKKGNKINKKTVWGFPQTVFQFLTQFD